MRRSKFSETQIVAILKDAVSAVPVADLLRKHGVSKATFFKWRSMYGGASVSDVKPSAEWNAMFVSTSPVRNPCPRGSAARSRSPSPHTSAVPRLPDPRAQRE